MGDKKGSEKVLGKLTQMYNKKGYWGDDPKDYYKQNWAWLGLEFYANNGTNIAELLNINSSVALIN